jgi:DNA-binding MarR family transcriptional regulator
MTVNTPPPSFVRAIGTSGSAPRLYLREEELDAGVMQILEAGLVLKKASAEAREKFDLSWLEARTLTVLLQAPLPVLALAAVLAINKQAVIKTLESLEGRGIVIRKTDPKDARKRIVFLTEMGSSFAKEISLAMRTILAHAYRAAGSQAVSGCDAVMGALNGIDPSQRHEGPA